MAAGAWDDAMRLDGGVMHVWRLWQAWGWLMQRVGGACCRVGYTFNDAWAGLS